MNLSLIKQISIKEKHLHKRIGLTNNRFAVCCKNSSVQHITTTYYGGIQTNELFVISFTFESITCL